MWTLTDQFYVLVLWKGVAIFTSRNICVLGLLVCFSMTIFAIFSIFEFNVVDVICARARHIFL